MTVTKIDNKISRTDAYLGILAIVYANAFESLDATSPNNGYNLNYTNSGITNPVWLGGVIQFLSVNAWFAYMVGLLLTLGNLFTALLDNREAPIIMPTFLYMYGTFVYYISMFFEDVAFWFSLFTNMKSDIDSSRVIMYLVTELQMLLFILFFIVFLIWFQKQFKQRFANPIESSQSIFSGMVRILCL